MGRGGDATGVLQGIPLFWDKNDLENTQHTNHGYEMARAVWSFGKEGSAMAGNHQASEHSHSADDLLDEFCYRKSLHAQILREIWQSHVNTSGIVLSLLFSSE